jgi:hypothetical protein
MTYEREEEQACCVHVELLFTQSQQSEVDRVQLLPEVDAATKATGMVKDRQKIMESNKSIMAFQWNFCGTTTEYRVLGLITNWASTQPPTNIEIGLEIQHLYRPISRIPKIPKHL